MLNIFRTLGVIWADVVDYFNCLIKIHFQINLVYLYVR